VMLDLCGSPLLSIGLYAGLWKTVGFSKNLSLLEDY
jgi:hypothetical protein